MACYPLGYLGLMLAPHDLAPCRGRCWSGVGTATSRSILTLIGLRARTAGGTAALSGFTQSTGYLIAAIGPFGDRRRCTTPPAAGPCRCWRCWSLTVPQSLLGLDVSRPAYVRPVRGIRWRAPR